MSDIGKNDKFHTAIKALGYCCPFEFFRQHPKLSSRELGNLTGCQPRTIRFWRGRSGCCASAPGCLNISHD
jgi:hypothetical protein